MMNMFTRSALIMAITIHLFSLPVFADQEGTSTATFLRLGQGARAEGMGGAFVAVANDAHAAYWNPAGLAQLTHREVALDHMEFIEDVASQYASFVVPFNRLNGTLALDGTFVDLGEIDRRNSAGAVVSGETDVNAMAGGAYWGQALGNNLGVGFGIKYFKQDLAGNEGTGAAGSGGILLFLVPDRLSVGASITNFGSKIKTGTRDENIPLTYRGGVAFYPILRKMVVAADYEKERDTDGILRAGVEYVFQNRFFGRVGYRDTLEAEGGFSAGVGFLWRPTREKSSGGDFFGKRDKEYERQDGFSIRFDYAFVDLGDFDSTHRVGITLQF